MIKDRASQVTFPMSDRSRGSVVPFLPRQLGTRRTPSGTAETGKKPVVSLVGLYEGRDAGLNADWDRFITLIAEAWCWRDPDCFAAVEDCLAQLRRSVDHDWS